MKCNQAKRLLVRLCDDELKGDLLECLNLHLESCQKCQRELKAFRRTMEILKKTELLSPDPGFWKDYLVGVRTRIAVSDKRKWAPRLIPSLTAAAVVILLAVLFLPERRKELDVLPSFWSSEQESVSRVLYAGSSDTEPENTVQLLAEKLLSPDEREALGGLYSPSAQVEAEVAVMEEEIELAYQAYYNP